jgi:hypothetical protein
VDTSGVAAAPAHAGAALAAVRRAVGVELRAAGAVGLTVERAGEWQRERSFRFGTGPPSHDLNMMYMFKFISMVVTGEGGAELT